MEALYRGTTDFWGGIESVTDKGRTCAVCGDVLYDYAKGNLCHRCVKRRQSDECQAFVRRIVEAAHRKWERDWWEATESDAEQTTLRVVGINLADASTEAVLEMLDSA